METHQIHLLEGYITPPRVVGLSDPMKTPENTHDILDGEDTTLDYVFNVLQQDQSHDSSCTPQPPISGMSHMFPTYFPHSSPI
jgi:hypothetical protein